jgi:lipid-binding SYLF domain-containing protein
MTLRSKVVILAGLTAILSAPLTIVPAAGPSDGAERELLQRASAVFERIANAPIAALPDCVLQQTQSIVVFPGATHNGSALRGRGGLSVRLPDGSWTIPAVLALDARVPVETEFPEVDIILLAQSRDGVEYLIPEGTIDAERAVTLGPLNTCGEPAEAALVAYMQFGDYFAGIPVTSLKLGAASHAHPQLYGAPLSIRQLAEGRIPVHVPTAARLWLETLRTYFSDGRAS